MKKVSLLLFVTLILLLAFVACNKHEHDFAAATCESPAKCSSCGEPQGEALGHKFTVATCTEPATCTVCGAVDGAALGHSWRDATCTTPKTCLTCNTTEGAPAAHKNDIVLEAKAPTCTATGLTQGTKCSACDATTKAQEVVPMLEHLNDVVLEAKDATCLETGLTAGVKCSACGTETTPQNVVPVLDHLNDIILEAVDPTCAKEGLTAGVKCSACGTETTPQKTLDTIPHTKATLPGKAATCTEDGQTEGAWCSVCEKILVPQAVIPASHQNVVDKAQKDATCLEDGYEAGKYCEACQTVIEGMDVIKAAGAHDLDDEGYGTNYKQGTCQASGSYDWIIACWNCDYKEVTTITDASGINPDGYEYLPQLQHVFTNYVYNGDAKCEEDGTETAVCDLCKEFPVPVTDTRVAVGSALGHLQKEDLMCGEIDECQRCDWYDPTPLACDWAPATCQVLSTCRRCGDTRGELAPCVPGEVVKENIVAPDCLTDGSWEDVTYCTVCGEECSRVPQVDPALGHNMAAATCTAPSTCTRCGYEEGEKRANHKLEMSYDGQALNYTCVGCEDRTFTIVNTDSSKSVYFDGTSALKGNATVPNDRDAGDNGQVRNYAYNTPTNGYYDVTQLDTATTRQQAQIWIKQYAKGLTGFSAANNAVGFYTGKFNFNFNYKNGNAEDMLSIKLVESHTNGNGNVPADQQYHWDSPQGSIQQNLFYITNVIENGKTVQYRITGYNNVSMYIDVEEGSNWSGWITLTAGIELDEENDLITVHYYINGEYWYSASLPLTTSADSITSVYMNLNTYGQGHGYYVDDLAFGYTANAEWNFDSCDHNLVKGATTAATCTTDGYSIYTCDKAGCQYTVKGDIVGALGHDIQNIAAQASTCVEQGWNEYSYCARCEDAAAAKEAALLPLVAHTPAEAVNENIVAETCITVGSYDSVVYCSVCKTYEFSRTPVTVDEYDGHMNLQVVKGYDSTCYATGLNDGEKCEACGVTTINQTVITKKAHTLVEYGAVTSAKPCETPNVIAGKKCSVEGCDHIEYVPYNDELAAHTEVAFGAVTSNTPCNPDTPSYLAGTKCSVCDKVLAQPTVAPTAAHTYGGDRICDVCGYEDVCSHENTTVLQAVNATCTATGLTEGLYCNDCGTTITAQTVVEKLAHTEATLEAVAATCTATGLTAGKECSVCHTVLEAQQTVAKLPHNEVAIPEVLATCTDTGLTEGKKCKDCGTVTLAQEVAPALGHLNDVPLAKVDPNCTDTGLTAGVKCSRCQVDTTPQEVVSALGHKMTVATCYVPSTCTVCGHTEGEAIANHTINATYKNSVLTYACTTCSDVFAPVNSVVYDGENTKYSIIIQNAKSEPNKGTLTVEDGAYKLESTVDERIQYLWFLPSNSKASTFKGFNAENNTFGIVSFEMTTDATEAFRFIVMEPRYDGSTNLWANDRGWDDNSMDLLAVTPVTENGKITKYNISGQSFTNATIATVGVDANGMSEKISVQMVMKLTDDMQFMISYYVNGAFYGVYTRDLVNTPVNDKGTMLQRINEGLIEAIYICGNTTGNGTGFILDNLYLGYTANAEWMFDACDHVYGDTTTVAPTCTTKGYDESVCTLCGFAKRENVKAALGHTATPSCMEEVTCTVCGEKAYDALNHNIITTYTDKLVYSCSRCDDYTVAIEDGYYNDGTGYNGFNTGITNNKAHGYTDRDDTLPEIVDGHYEFIKDDSYAGSGQVQIWMPKSGTHDKLQGFTIENEALGIFSMKINMNLDKGNLRVILVDINDKTANGWASNNQINALMTFNVPSNGQIRLDVWGKNDIAKLDIGADGWTGDIDVRVVMKLTSNGNLTAMYYINGELLYTHTAACPITTGSINALYITGNSTAAGTGYIFDDLAYGYTPYGHWTLDGKEHVVTPSTACNVPASCTCGWTGLGLDHDLTPATCAAPATCKDCGAQVGEKASHDFSVLSYDKSTHNVIYSCSNDCGTGCTLTGYYYDGTDTSYNYVANGNMPLDNSKGYYEYIFTAKGEEQTTANGWAQNVNNSKWGAQPMFWIPTRNNEAGLNGLNAENNSTGIISFRMRSNMTDAFTFAIGKERSYASWDADGGWKLNFNIFQISAYSDAGITINNVYGGTKAIATIPAAGDGWSEWFDMDIIISLKDNGAITLDYYVNDAHVHTASGTLYTVPSTGKFLDIRAVYINGWTYQPGTGLAFDDFTFGKLHHNIFDGNEHVMSDACGAPISCSCGYVSTIDNPHNWTVSTSCTDYATCTNCGAKGSALAHEVTASIVDSKPTYGCKNCTTTFAPSVYVNGDGSSTSLMSTEQTNLLTTATDENGNSYYSVLNTDTSGALTKGWVWLNGTGTNALNRLPEFSCANNSSGVISFKLNLQGDANTELYIRPAYGRGIGEYWQNYNGVNDAWDDCVFYLLKLSKASGNTRTVLATDNSTVATINMNEWVEFTIKIELSDDGTMNVDYYVNGELTLSTGDVNMPLYNKAINAVLFELQTSTANTGYLLDDFTIGYSNDGHWNLDGKNHTMISDTLTCASGLKCACGWETAPLAHDNLTPVVTANGVSYKCEDCDNDYALNFAYVIDGSNYDNMTGASNKDRGFTVSGDSSNPDDPIIVTDNGDSYYKLFNAGSSAQQGQIWIPKNTTNAPLDNLTCANNATAYFSIDLKLEMTTAIEFKVCNDKDVAGSWANPNGANSGWSDSCFLLMQVKASNNNTRTLTSAFGDICTIDVSQWNKLTAVMDLHDDGTMTVHYYVNGALVKTFTNVNMPVWKKALDSVYINTPAQPAGSGYYFDDVIFGYAA